MDQAFYTTERNPSLLFCHEPSTICSFNELETFHYPSRILRRWSAQWAPSYVWSNEGLIADPIVATLYNRIIVIPNSYTLFRYEEGSYIPIESYSSIASQEYHRHIYPYMHSLREDSAKANQFEHARIDSPNNTLNFILLWHMDHANYWHFTFDIAFRLFYFITHFPLLIPRLRLVVVGTNSLSPFQHDLLAAILGSKPKLIFSPVSAIVESALFIPPVQTLLTRKDWLVSYSRVLSSRLTTNLNAGLDNGAVHNSGSSQRQMLYIQRGITKNPRVLLNEQEVIRILKKSGFSICDPGRLTIHDQARLFHSADLVVGPHGSAFTNILYMKPRSRVIEFTNSTYDPFHDFFLARQLDISFTRIRQNDSIANTLCHQPFRVDILKVERAVTLDQVSLHK